VSDATRVVLADDHAPTRMGVSMSLRAGGFIVVGEAATAHDAVELALRLEPAVVVLDVNMPGGGVEAARQIKTARPQMAVVMLSVAASDDDLFEAIAAGADGYLVKTMSAERLSAALRGVLAGEAALPRVLAARLMTEFRVRAGPGPAAGRRAASNLSDRLTARELEVLALMIQELPTGVIAARLGIREVTVRRHISAIVHKAGAQGRREAVRFLSAEFDALTPRDLRAAERTI
jgi:DNA-binding NarL/FixJ family response regulator